MMISALYVIVDEEKKRKTNDGRRFSFVLSIDRKKKKVKKETILKDLFSIGI